MADHEHCRGHTCDGQHNTLVHCGAHADALQDALPHSLQVQLKEQAPSSMSVVDPCRTVQRGESRTSPTTGRCSRLQQTEHSNSDADGCEGWGSPFAAIRARLRYQLFDYMPGIW